MRIIPWRPRRDWLEPFQSIDDIQKEMGRVFGYRLAELSKGIKEDEWLPPVDIQDAKDNITVKAEIPGMSKDQIDVRVENDILTIKGEKKEEKEVEEKNSVRTERYYGGFERSFTLPSGIDSKSIKASYKDGVLVVVLPKKDEAKSKQVKVDVN